MQVMSETMDESKLTEYLRLKLEMWETYHNHKENMANAGFLVQLSLFSGMVTQAIWPPEWVANVTTLPKLGTFSVFLLLWFLIHYYTRWQLINKRVAAMYYAGFDNALLHITTKRLSQEDLAICDEDTHAPSPWKDFLSKIIYVPHGYLQMDASIKGLPLFVSREIKTLFSKGSGAVTLEVLITYTSILLMGIVALKIFLG
jgi:hypothetical protein